MSDEITDVYHRAKWALALRGLIGVAVGIIIFARPLASVAALALVIALWALFDGIVRIVHAFELRPVAAHWWVLLLTGLVGVAFGGAALDYYPALSLAFAVVWVTLWLIIAGAMGAYVAMQERRLDLPWGWTMTWSILAIVGGVLAFMYPGITLAGLMGLIAAFGIIGGIVMLVGAGKMQSFEHDVSHAARRAVRP